MSSRPTRIVFPLLIVFASLAGPRSAYSQPACDTITSRVGFAGLAGVPIRSVDVVRLPPALLGGPGRGFQRFHAATRASTIRRELLFSAGEPLDTLRVAESLRRLRALSYLEDVQLQARTCPDSIGVALTVLTRDSWSEQPVFAARARSVTLGVAESNALGSGRLFRLTAQSDVQGFGGGVTVRDPALWNGALDAQLGSTLYATGSSWLFAVRPRRRTIADAWTGDLRVTGSHREVEGGPGDTFDRNRAALLFGPRLTSALAPHAAYLLVGVESEHANVNWLSFEPLVGPNAVNRRFVGADIGLTRRATRFDTLGWVLRQGGIVDVPNGIEGEVVTGYGRDYADGRDKIHVDGWSGRIWTLRNGALLVGGVWANGFVAGHALEAGTTRASLVGLVPAPNGAWTMRLAVERLYDPDPNVRALASIDPIGAMLPRDARLAEGAASASLERDLRLHDISRSTELDAALFGAFARRWDLASIPDADVGAAIVGVGLRLAPSRTPRAMLRLDLGYPVAYRASLPARPMLAVTITPWLTMGRQRDGLQSP